MKKWGFWLFVLALWPVVSRSETILSQNTADAIQDLARDESSEAFPALPEMPEGWSALPRGRPFPVLPSDPRDLKLGLRENNKGELEADVGGYRSVAGWRGADLALHLGIEGNGYFQMRHDGSKFPLASSDGLVGLYGEAARGPWAYQLRYTHISAHLSDGLFGVRTPFVYTREFLQLRAALSLGYFRPYAGYQILTHTAPELPRHSLQLGGYEILPAHYGIVHPYFGADLRIRNAQEGTTFELGAGAALLSHLGAP
ncbi:MAG: hypothetical protein ACXVCS_22255, partial [Bdellovibrionota bacterium]